MIKRVLTGILLAALVFCCSGCSFSIEDVAMPSLPQLDLSSSLTVEVIQLSGKQCLALVTQGDGAFDEDDMVLLTYENVTGNIPVKYGTVLSLDYTYVEDVSSVQRYKYNGETYRNLPHIIVETVTPE